jgi:hypothetical protein
MKALAFSRDRACQLDALLRSLAMHAAEPVDVEVIYRATTERHVAAYRELAYGAANLNAGLEREYNFEAQVRRAIAAAGEHVLLLVDDTVFVRRWSPAWTAHALTANQFAIGVSLRLGENTTHCYPSARDQVVPMHESFDDWIAWRWPGEDGDFGYPLELSSSVYRTDDIQNALMQWPFRSPNELEALLARRTCVFAQTRPWLMSYETSVAFSVPANRVQNTYANRAGSNPELSAEALLQAWEAGYRIDVEALAGHTPRGAHEEVPFKFVRRTP